MKEKDIGVINEQGYVAGAGLGFNGLDKKDKKKLKNMVKEATSETKEVKNEEK